MERIKQIFLKDNSTGPEVRSVLAALPARTAAALDDIAGKSLKTLCEERPGFLVYPGPEAWSDSGGSCGWGEEYGDFLFQWDSNSGNEKRFRTGNVVGVFGIGFGAGKEHSGGKSVQIAIGSRFDGASSSQYFLHSMLQRVFCGYQLLDLPTSSSEEQLQDLLYYLFPSALNKACRQGLLRKYRTFQYNTPCIRGIIDIPRHIQLNVPFRGNIACQSRELTTNNPVTQLVRHAIEVIRKKNFGRRLLSLDAETRETVRMFEGATPDFQSGDAAKVISQNLRSVRHPFYTEYEPLRKLSLMILRHEKIGFAGSEKGMEISGIVFKAEWLWEEYLASILRNRDNSQAEEESRFVHPKNAERENPIYLYEGNKQKAYPDFYNDRLILDAKYKHLEKGISREDRYQMISYLHVRKAAAAFLLYPGEKRGGNSEFVEESLEGTLNGHGGDIGAVALVIPQSSEAENFEEYGKWLKSMEKAFLDRLREQNKRYA